MFMPNLFQKLVRRTGQEDEATTRVISVPIKDQESNLTENSPEIISRSKILETLEKIREANNQTADENAAETTFISKGVILDSEEINQIKNLADQANKSVVDEKTGSQLARISAAIYAYEHGNHAAFDYASTTIIEQLLNSITETPANNVQAESTVLKAEPPELMEHLETVAHINEEIISQLLDLNAPVTLSNEQITELRKLLAVYESKFGETSDSATIKKTLEQAGEITDAIQVNFLSVRVSNLLREVKAAQPEVFAETTITEEHPEERVVPIEPSAEVKPDSLINADSLPATPPPPDTIPEAPVEIPAFLRPKPDSAQESPAPKETTPEPENTPITEAIPDLAELEHTLSELYDREKNGTVEEITPLQEKCDAIIAAFKKQTETFRFNTVVNETAFKLKKRTAKSDTETSLSMDAEDQYQSTENKYNESLKQYAQAKLIAYKSQLYREEITNPENRKNHMNEYVTGELFKEVIIDEQNLYQQELVKQRSEQDQSILKKAGGLFIKVARAYSKIPKGLRYAITPAIITGTMVATGALPGIAAGATMFGVKFGKALASGTMAAATEKLSSFGIKIWESTAGITKTAEYQQEQLSQSFHEAPAENEQETNNAKADFFLTDLQNLREQNRKIVETRAKREKRQNIAKLLLAVGAGLGTAAVSTNIEHLLGYNVPTAGIKTGATEHLTHQNQPVEAVAPESAPDTTIHPSLTDTLSTAEQPGGLDINAHVEQAVNQAPSEPIMTVNLEGAVPTTVAEHLASAAAGPEAIFTNLPHDEAIKALELATVHKGEGIWHAVYRQLDSQVHTHPDQFGLTPEQLEDHEKLTRILNAETAKLIHENGLADQGISQENTIVGVVDGKIKIVGGDTYTIKPNIQPSNYDELMQRHIKLVEVNEVTNANDANNILHQAEIHPAIEHQIPAEAMIADEYGKRIIDNTDFNAHSPTALHSLPHETIPADASLTPEILATKPVGVQSAVENLKARPIEFHEHVSQPEPAQTAAETAINNHEVHLNPDGSETFDLKTGKISFKVDPHHPENVQINTQATMRFVRGTELFSKDFLHKMTEAGKSSGALELKGRELILQTRFYDELLAKGYSSEAGLLLKSLKASVKELTKQFGADVMNKSALPKYLK